MEMKDKPNKLTAVLKVIVTGEFYDDDSTEETLRYAVEQDLEDAGFDVDVALLKEQEAEIAFLKEMQLQTIHNMSNEDIGNAVRNVLRFRSIVQNDALSQKRK